MASPSALPESLQAASAADRITYGSMSHTPWRTSKVQIASGAKQSRVKSEQVSRSLNDQFDGDESSWCGQPVQPDIASQRWNRKYGNVQKTAVYCKLQEYDGAVVVAHYNKVKIVGLGHVYLGDFVEVHSDEAEDENHISRPWIMQVTELFEDVKGGRYFSGHWFYSLWNTALVVQTNGAKEDPVSLERERVFRASDHDNQIYDQGANAHGNTQSLQTIIRRVTVKHVPPGCTDPGNCDYWFNQEHDRRFFTFIDRYPEGCSPAAASTGTHLPRVLNAVDLYCGCGGMSFVDHKTDRVHINTHWAVDNEESACCSFRVNYPDAAVSCH